jgi:hypothetical protein
MQTALGAVALLLSPLFSRVYIPSSHDYSQLVPWGTHPLVDPLWSTDDLEVVHDGCEATRLEKTALIASHDVALRHLWVCWGGRFNCGDCNKCQRTILALQALGALDRCTTFRRGPFRPAEAARIPFYGDLAATTCYIEEIIEFLDASGKDPRLARALRDAVKQKYYRGLGRLLRGDLRRRLMRRLESGLCAHRPKREPARPGFGVGR